MSIGVQNLKIRLLGIGIFTVIIEPIVLLRNFKNCLLSVEGVPFVFMLDYFHESAIQGHSFLICSKRCEMEGTEYL